MTTWTRKELAEIANVFRGTDKRQVNFENGDTCGLWLLNSHLPRLGAHELHRNLNKRWKLMARIKECQRIDGRMFVTESGRDCDGVQYSGQVHECDANLRAYEKLYYDINEWADGPFSLYPITVAERNEVIYQSRDLAMEAYEDGHPHSLSAARYDEDGSY